MASGLAGAVVLLAVAAIGIPSGSAVAQTEPVDVQLIGTARILDAGNTLEVRAIIRCDPVGEVLEALVTASQDENAVAGEGFFVSGIRCDGHPHLVTGRIQVFDGLPFHRGEAHVSAFLLLLDFETGETFSGQDTRSIRVR